MSKANKNINNNEIIKGFRFFESSSNSIQPQDLKNLMEKLGLKNKTIFTYNIVDSLCSNKEIKRKGGITKAEFTPYLEEKMDEIYNKEGFDAISSLLRNPKKNSTKKNKLSQEKVSKYEELIKKELNLNINDIDPKIIDFYEKRQKNKTYEKMRKKDPDGKYRYNFGNRFHTNKNVGLKNEA